MPTPAPGRARLVLVDALLAAAALTLSITVVSGPAARQMDGLAWILVVGHEAPIALRRLVPVPALGVSLGAAVVYLALSYPIVGLALAPLVVIYSVASILPRRHAVPALIVALAAMAVDRLADDNAGELSTFLGNVLVLAAAWLLGDSIRRRRDEAARAQVEATARAALDERLRIAREMHDIVAHSMSVIVVQAGTGRMVLDDDPDRARAALSAIEETGRQALDELRHVLGVLRSEAGTGDAGAGRADALRPVPSLRDLPRLFADAGTSGTPVDIEIDGDDRPFASGVEATAYRAIQEALTNVRRHAPGMTARVRIGYRSDGLSVEVVNDRSPASPSTPATSGPGRGLAGMRERVEASGGSFAAGPTPAGGFRLCIELPDGTPT